MAHIYTRKNSPFWWIRYRDPKTDSLVQESTGFLHGNGADTRRARELEAQKTLAERQSVKTNRSERWDAWVKDFIARRYKDSPGSRTRFSAAWRTISMFLDEKEITLPRQLTYKHCDDYLTWRETPDERIGKYKATHNTAILELKFLGIVMGQAVREGMAQGNPIRELVLKRKRVKVFPKYSDDNIQLIVDGIHAEPKKKFAFLWPSFLIAYYHGVRLVETHFNPQQRIKLIGKQAGRIGTITFKQKGGKIRSKPLHPELVPFFKQLLEQKVTETFPLPKSFAKEWHNFFHRCGLKAIKPNACFHSLRVTVQNRLRVAGVSKEIRKAYLSHDGKDDVNEMYDRIDDFDDIDEIDCDEMLACHAPLNRTWTEPVKPPLRVLQTLDAAA